MIAEKKEKSNAFNQIFAFLCFVSVAHYVSIADKEGIEIG